MWSVNNVAGGDSPESAKQESINGELFWLIPKVFNNWYWLWLPKLEADVFKDKKTFKKSFFTG
jgi:hypothetical protein